MRVAFQASFARDLKKIKDRIVRQRVQAMIEQVEAAGSLHDVASIKPVTGHPGFYRGRVGDHRVGMVLTDDEVSFIRCIHRRDFYRYFP